MAVGRFLDIAFEHYQAGRFAAVEEFCRRVLFEEGEHPENLHLLGLMAYQTRRNELAAAVIGRAIVLRPDVAEYHSNLGLILTKLGRIDEAIAVLRTAASLSPQSPEVHNNLGNALREMGSMDEALAAYQTALRLAPDFAMAHNNLGIALQKQGQHVAAIASYRKALELQPDFSAAYVNSGTVYQGQRETYEAIQLYESAVRLDAGNIEAHYNLGVVHQSKGWLDTAKAAYERVLEIDSGRADAIANLGNIFKEQGDLDQAIACYRQATSLKPSDATADSNLVYTLHFQPDQTPEAICHEARWWNQQHAASLPKVNHPRPRTVASGQRLRIGYISPDFRDHPVGRFILPLLKDHDHDGFEVFCYSDVTTPDDFTSRINACADVTQTIVGASDEQMAELVRQDGIDILIDLTMHMSRNRLLVFARKPAPVQVTYLAYCSTTGLDAIDYRITDPYLDPLPVNDAHYSEKSIHLPRTYWCYQPAVPARLVTELPAKSAGYVTFGCLNNFCKVTAPTLGAWRRVLSEMPRSQLLLHAYDGSHRQRVRDFFAAGGVSPERLSFVGHVPLADYYASYDKIDIALDPFPYNGGTTTCDALWMGVPVVSLAGRAAVSRAGLSLLSNIGLPELVALDEEKYVELVTRLASDTATLSEMRRTLRTRMEASPLMDATQFARDVESAYLKMWN